MLRRSVKVQLMVFVLITLAGVSYVSAEYVGLFRGIGSNACTVSAQFPDSGGIFTNAEVTYRGVTVGRVGQLSLIDKGVQVQLNLSDCDNPEIPADTSATVSDRSVIGEQYVNLVPPNGAGPYLSGGEIIPLGRTKVPVSTQELLTNLDDLVNSVDIPALQTTIAELGKAFANRGPDLGRLLDSSNALLDTAQQNLPTTIALIKSASTVLSTQLDEAGPLQSFTRDLQLLSAQLKASDPDIRALLDRAPADLSVVRDFVRGNRTDLGVVLANLATTGDLLVRHLDGIEQILELYPAMVAGGETSLHSGGACGNTTCGSLGFIAQVQDDPPDCGDPKKGGQGYSGTDRRQPGDTSPQAPNVSARCTAPASSGTNVRGSANVPGGDPISASGGGVAYPRADQSADSAGSGNSAGSEGSEGSEGSGDDTGNTVRLGDVGGRAAILGDRSWIAILTTALN